MIDFDRMFRSLYLFVVFVSVWGLTAAALTACRWLVG